MRRAGQRAVLALSIGAMVVGALCDVAATAGRTPGPPDDYRTARFVPVILDFPPQATVSPTVPPRPAPPVHPTVVTIAPPTAPPGPTVGLPTVAEAKAWVYATLGPTQGDCLVDIIRHEDGTWDPHRWSTTGSGAYGIPQALPGSKMATAGADWRDNRITQVRWMIGYVDGRYGSACQAAAFRDRNGWY